ncbi:hypothetical protein [Shimazuella alba]|uniref:Uncharacterized protein n=1 Tax=Shimazuella alba TaxID=2690964 RepID=A0A6I4VZU5_9BACL|nr:hypothetical protein [Shimazuella alba]MXQ55480.1 hypothetical protein [Shimazuella alba]
MNQKSYQCPLCNGFTTYTENCPKCHQQMVDYGPASFLLADYSPYRPIDDMKQNDGWIDNQTHKCPHEVYCPNCGFDKIDFISEQET